MTVGKINTLDVLTPTEADGKIAAVISSGSYTGDGSDDRAIPHGLGVEPRIVLVANADGVLGGRVQGTRNINLYLDDVVVVSDWDATDFHVSNATVQFNTNLAVFNWVAFS